MAVNNLIRVSLHGTGVGEEFMIGWHAVGGVPGDFSDLQAAVDDWLGEMTGSDEWADFRTLQSTDQVWDRGTMEYWAVSGGPADIIAQGAIAAADGAGLGSSFLPLQTALVVSTHTNSPGASGRGRIFVPFTGQQTANAHRVNVGFCDALVADMRSFLIAADGAIATHCGGTSDASVYSPTHGTSAEITRLSVDNRPDTQRRRAASLTATANSSLLYN